MVKNSQTQNSSATPAATKSARWSMTGSIIFTLSILGIFGTGIWYLYQNPQILNFSAQNGDIKALQQQMNQLETRLHSLERLAKDAALAKEMKALRRQTEQFAAEWDKKFEKTSDINKELLDSKASNANMLGVISRVDDLETKVNSLGKVSTQNALILTAAGLVKDTAETGRPFEYEAEVLRQLTIGTNMQQAAETIAYYAADGMKSQEDLIDDFNRLYDAKEAAEQSETEATSETEAESSANWKEMLNSKLSKLVVVEYRNGNTDSSALPEDKIYALVNRGDFKQASALMLNHPSYQSEEFKTWQKQAAVREEISRAIKKIQSLTLAAIKVENFKEGNN